jgi:hypothetical protein
MFYGLHRNYSLGTILAMYKRIKSKVPKLPDLIVKNEDWETCPAEYCAEIESLIKREKVIKKEEKGFCERFAANKQMNDQVGKRFREKLRKNKK